MGEGKGTVFDTGSSVDYNSGLNCRVFKKVDNSCSYMFVKKTMSLNHSSVNRLPFCSVSPCCSIWCTYVQNSISTFGGNF